MLRRIFYPLIYNLYWRAVWQWRIFKGEGHEFKSTLLWNRGQICGKKWVAKLETDKSIIIQVKNDSNMDFWVECPNGEGWGMKKEWVDEMIQEYFDKHF